MLSYSVHTTAPAALRLKERNFLAVKTILTTNTDNEDSDFTATFLWPSASLHEPKTVFRQLS